MKIFLIALMLAVSGLHASTPPSPPPFAKIPVYFEPNLGQFHPSVRFVTRGANYRALITDQELVLLLGGRHQKQEVTRIRFGKKKPSGAEGLEPFPGISNYFRGQDPRKWVTKVPNYAKAKLTEVYKGIDVVFYAAGRNIEYDFIVKPGADASQIEVTFEGQETLHAEPSGLISLRTENGELQHRPPRVFQGNKSIAVYPRLDGRTLRMPVGEYDHNQELTVDPTLVYSTMVGGNRTDVVWDQDAHLIQSSVRVDASGNLYFAGLTFEYPVNTNSFPTTSGVLASTFQGGVSDAVVVKLNPTGTALVFSTYLGSGDSDGARGVAIDSNLNVYVTGTGGTTFPTTSGSFQASRTVAGQPNLFVSKLAVDGSSLVYSTFVGSAGEAGQLIEVTAAGEAVVASGTCGPSMCGTGQGLPTPLVNPAQANFGGAFADATLIKLNAAGSALVFSTYHGVATNEWATGLGIGPTGDIFMAGAGAGPVTSGVYSNSASGSTFVAKFSSTGSLVWATRIGTIGNDRIFGLAVDSQNRPVITGRSAGWPTTTGTIQTTNPSTCANQFLTKLNDTGTDLVFSTIVAGKVNYCHTGWGVAIDSADNMWVVGNEYGWDGTTAFPVTNDAHMATGTATSAQTKNDDMTLAKINPTGTQVLYGTYLGSTGYDIPVAVTVDAAGANVWVAGVTGSSAFPTTPGVVGPTFQGGLDFVFLKITTTPPPPPPVNVTITSSPVGMSFSATGTGCAPGSYVTPQILTWTAGSSCVVAMAAPQMLGPIKFSFVNWEDSSTLVTRSITAPNTATTYTATFGALPVLTAAIQSKVSGTGNERIWTIAVTNSGPGQALNARITSATATVTGGPGPVSVVTATPITIGTIAVGGGVGTAPITLSFPATAPLTRIRLNLTLTSNNGDYVLPVVFNNQFR